MASRLDILPVKKLAAGTPKRELHEHLPKPPFMMSIVAKPASGKSNLLVNLLYNKNFYRDYFDEIYFISPTIMIDDTLEAVRGDDTIIKIHEDLEALDELLSTIVESQEKQDGDVLVVLDDCIGFLSKGLTHLATRYRHYKISIIISIQNFRTIPLIVRNCSSCFVFFGTHNDREKKKMEEEFGGSFPKFIECFDKATHEKYSFLFVDMRKMQLFENFLTRVK